MRLHRDPFTEEHPFTVTSAAQDRHTVEFTIRHAGDWTDELRRLQPGDPICLDGPHCSFTIHHTSVAWRGVDAADGLAGVVLDDHREAGRPGAHRHRGGELTGVHPTPGPYLQSGAGGTSRCPGRHAAEASRHG
jgi:FAD-binding domain